MWYTSTITAVHTFFLNRWVIWQPWAVYWERSYFLASRSCLQGMIIWGYRISSARGNVRAVRMPGWCPGDEQRDGACTGVEKSHRGNETQDSTEDTASIHVLFVQRDKSDLIRSYYTNHLPYHVASACHGWVECTSLKREAAIWCIEGKGVQWIQWNLSKFNRGLPRINKFDGKVHFINIIFLYILETILLKINKNWYLIWNSKLHRNQMKEYSTEHSKCILQNTINWTAILDFISLYFIILYNLIFTA